MKVEWMRCFDRQSDAVTIKPPRHTTVALSRQRRCLSPLSTEE